MSPQGQTLPISAEDKPKEPEIWNLENYIKFLLRRLQNADARSFRLGQVGVTGINYDRSQRRYLKLIMLSAFGFLPLPWMVFYGYSLLTRMKHEQHFSEHMKVLNNFYYSSDPNIFALNVEREQQKVWERAIYGVKLSKAKNLEQQREEQQQRAALIQKFCKIVLGASGRDFTAQEKGKLFQLANAIEEKDNLFASVSEWDLSDHTKIMLNNGIKPILDKFANSGMNDRGQVTGQGYVCNLEEREKLLKMANELKNVTGCILQANEGQLAIIKRLEHQVAKKSLIHDWQYATARSAYLLNLQARKWRLNARTHNANIFRQAGRNAFAIGLPLGVFMASGFGILGMMGGAILSLPLAAAYTAFQHWGAKRYPGHRLFYQTAEDHINYIDSQTAAAKTFSGDLETAVKESRLGKERATQAVRKGFFRLEPKEIRRIDGIAHLIYYSIMSRLSRKIMYKVNTPLVSKWNNLGVMPRVPFWRRFVPFGSFSKKPSSHIQLTQMSGELLGSRQTDYVR